ncbi:MAG: LamG domain-containing protein, partial [Alcanivoracaceae bacterium]|nr:LamG domain-containing protein [Alcanivoracaceae bacterium]
TARGAFSFDSLDNNWHHMALVYSGGQTQLYIDGVLVDTVNKVPEGTLKFIGTSFDGVNSSNPQGFRAPLDEFIIFDGVLSAAEILELYNNQNAENNYDGSTRAQVTCGLVAHYAMDEATWLSGTNLVIDGVNAINGTAFNGANTIGVSCRYGQFDGVDDYIQIPHDDALNGSDVLTYVAYIRPDSWTGLDQIMAKSVHGGGSGRAQMGVFSENGVFKVRAETVDGRIEINDTLPVPAGDWVHVAAVFSATSLTLYIDGVNVASTTFSATTLVQTTDPLNISKRVGTDVYYFHGLIDDVRVYRSALTQQEVSDLMTSVTPCPLNPIDHFEISHDGNGLTCQPETITIKACADESCSTLNADATDVQLFINGVLDQTVTVSGGNTNTSFSYTNIGTATLSLDQTFECKNGGSTSCDVVFANAGFRFLYGNVESLTIGNQVSGNSFTDVVKLQAVENVNGVCTGLFTGNKDVELSQQNIAPGGTTGLSFKVNGSGGTSINKYPNYTSNITLNFGVDSKATIPAPVYLDAGQIRLHAKYNVGGVNLVGNTDNDFWVSPNKLVGRATAIAGGSNIDGNTNTSPTIHNAGQIFNFSVTAYNSIGTAVESITANYSPNDIQLLLTRTGPTTGGVEGSFNYGNGTIFSALTPAAYQSVTLANFNSGVSASSSASYSEVGLLNLDIQDINYGFANNRVEADETNIGRFIPAYFELTNSAVEDACNNFTYMGESKLKLTYEITAKNSQNGVTANYITNIDPSKNYVNSVVTLVAENNNDGIALSARLMSYQGEWVGGVYHNEEDIFPSEDVGEFIRAPDHDGPYDNLLIGIKLTDGDGRALSDLNMKVDASNDCGVSNNCNAKTLSLVKSKIRFGRWTIENTFGSERTNLPFPMAVQYFDGNGFVTNTLDTCTAFDGDNAANYSLSVTGLNNPLPAVNLTSISGSGVFALGIAELEINQPSDGFQGQVRFTYEATPTWLQYDWNWDGVTAKDFSDNPSATATFGLFRGNDRIIYQREVHN